MYDFEISLRLILSFIIIHDKLFNVGLASFDFSLQRYNIATYIIEERYSLNKIKLIQYLQWKKNYWELKSVLENVDMHKPMYDTIWLVW